MPQGGASNDLVPGADPREWGVHRHPAGDPIRILRSKRVAHHVADIMGDKVGPLDLQLVENTRDIAALGFLVIAIFGMRREPHSPQGCPHVARVAEAVQHDDGQPSTWTWMVAPPVLISWVL